MSQNLAPPPYEQIIESKNIFLDSQEASEYPDSNRIQFNFENPITVGANEKIRLSIESIYGSRPFTMVNQSNRYYYMILSTPDGEYWIRQAMDVFDYQTHYTLAYKFLESIKNPSQRRTIVSSSPSVATDADVSSSEKFDVFNISYSNSIENALSTIKEKNKPDNAFERKVFGSLQDFYFEAEYTSGSGNGRVYSFQGNLSGNNGFTQQTIDFIEFVFPSSKKFSTIYDLQDLYLLTGGKREVSLNPSQSVRYTNTGLVSSRVELTNNVNLAYQNNRPANGVLGNIGTVLVQNGASNNIGSGKGFDFSIYELEINSSSNYTFDISSFRGTNIMVGLIHSFFDDRLKPVSTQNVSHVLFKKLRGSEFIDAYHPFDNPTASGNPSTITFSSADLAQGARIVYIDFVNETLIAGDPNSTFYSKTLRLFLETNLSSYPLPLFKFENQQIYVNTESNITHSEIRDKFAYGFNNTLGKFESGASFIDGNYINDRTSSGVQTFYKESNGDLFKNNVRIQKGLYTENTTSNTLYIASQSPMTLVSQPYTYIRATGGSGNLSNSLFNTRASPFSGISNSQIIARAANQEDIIVHNNQNVSPAKTPTGFFVEINDSNLTNIEIELTDHRGRNIVNADWSFFYGPLFVNMMIRLDRIRINKQKGVPTTLEERDGMLNKNQFLLDSTLNT